MGCRAPYFSNGGLEELASSVPQRADVIRWRQSWVLCREAR
jgi:hypothetical protein